MNHQTSTMLNRPWAQIAAEGQAPLLMGSAHLVLEIAPKVGASTSELPGQERHTCTKRIDRESAQYSAFLSTSTNDEESGNRPSMAPVSSTSGAVAASIPLLYGPDGSIDLPRLTGDAEKSAPSPCWVGRLARYDDALPRIYPSTQHRSSAQCARTSSTSKGDGGWIRISNIVEPCYVVLYL